MAQPVDPPGDPDSLMARVRERAARHDGAPALAAFGRTWSYRQVLARSERMAAVLARLGVGPGRPLGLLLPPVPTAAMAAMAAFRLGATVVPCDPMQSGDALLARLRAVGPGVMLTLDLTRLQQRWVALLDETEITAVLVEKMAELLPFPRNLLMPLLRGGEIAAVPRHPRVAALARLLRAAPAMAGAAGAPAALLGQGERRIEESHLLQAVQPLVAHAGGARRWLLAHHLDGAWALAALLAPLTAGREVVVLPRVDPATAAAALAHERPQVAVLSDRLAAALAAARPAPAGLDLAVVPPRVPADVRDALARAAGCRVVVWDGPAPPASGSGG